jgi:hypothetical protein
MSILDLLLGAGIGFIASLFFINYIVTEVFSTITMFTINPMDFLDEIDKDKDK